MPNTDGMSVEQLKALITGYEAAKAKRQTISFKVSEKGGVSMYGLGRFPVTLYLSQWERLVAEVPSLVAFIGEHRSELAVKE